VVNGSIFKSRGTTYLLSICRVVYMMYVSCTAYDNIKRDVNNLYMYIVYGGRRNSK
jgi:hypothetical protein